MPIVLMLSLGFASWLSSAVAMAAAPSIPWTLIATHEHDRGAFTQGLVVDGPTVFESVGLYGRSGLVARDLVSGRVLAARPLPADQFGEGTTVVGSKIIMLTWQNKIGHVFDHRLKPLRSFSYEGEGWGLTHDGTRLIRSDGTARLRFHGLDDYRETGSVVVKDGNTPVRHLNELEYVDGLVFANVWQTDRVAIIDPVSGQVLAWLDLSALSEKVGLVAGRDTDDSVLNGIAVVGPHRLLVTGKFWPAMFEIEVDMRIIEKP